MGHKTSILSQAPDTDMGVNLDTISDATLTFDHFASFSLSSDLLYARPNFLDDFTRSTFFFKVALVLGAAKWIRHRCHQQVLPAGPTPLGRVAARGDGNFDIVSHARDLAGVPT